MEYILLIVFIMLLIGVIIHIVKAPLIDRDL